MSTPAGSATRITSGESRRGPHARDAVDPASNRDSVPFLAACLCCCAPTCCASSFVYPSTCTVVPGPVPPASLPPSRSVLVVLSPRPRRPPPPHAYLVDSAPAPWPLLLPLDSRTIIVTHKFPSCPPSQASPVRPQCLTLPINSSTAPRTATPLSCAKRLCLPACLPAPQVLLRPLPGKPSTAAGHGAGHRAVLHAAPGVPPAHQLLQLHLCGALELDLHSGDRIAGAPQDAQLLPCRAAPGVP